MPDQAGRPTLNDWAQVSNTITNIGRMKAYGDARKAEAEKTAQEKQAAALTADILAGQTPDFAGVDPVVANKAESDAIKLQLDRQRQTENSMRLRALKHSQELEDLRETVKNMRAAKDAGDMDLFTRLGDHAYSLIPDGNHIQNRKGSVVTLAAPTGVTKKVRDDLTPDQKISMLSRFAQDEQAYFKQKETLDATRRSFNEEQWQNPVPKRNKKGEIHWFVRQIDPDSGKISELEFDHEPTATSEPVKNKSSEPYYSYKEMVLKNMDKAGGVDPLTLNQGISALKGHFYKTGLMGQIENRTGKSDDQYRVAEHKFFQLINTPTQDGGPPDVYAAVIAASDYVDKIERSYARALSEHPEDKKDIDAQFKAKFRYLPKIPNAK